MTKRTRFSRLILVSQFFYPANVAAAARYKPLVSALMKFYDVTVYTSRISRGRSEFIVKCNWVPFPSNQKSNIFRLLFETAFGVETFIRILFSKGDIYYLGSPSFINCTFAALCCKLLGKPYLVDIRDDYPRVYFDSGLIKETGFIGRQLKWIERTICENAILVVAATEGLKKNIELFQIKESWLLRNGYSEDLFNPASEKFKDFTLVFHGILSNFQDVDLLVNLGRLIDQRNLDIKIVVAGEGNQDYKLKVNLPRSVTYLGPKSHAEIAGLINKAHVGLSFRKPGKISEDSFPVKIYEYIGVGLPILVTPPSEAGEYVQKSGIGFQFDPQNEEAILGKILEIKEKASLYDELQENLATVRPVFSREKMSSAFVSYLVSKHPHSQGLNAQKTP